MRGDCRGGSRVGVVEGCDHPEHGSRQHQGAHDPHPDWESLPPGRGFREADRGRTSGCRGSLSDRRWRCRAVHRMTSCGPRASVPVAIERRVVLVGVPARFPRFAGHSRPLRWNCRRVRYSWSGRWSCCRYAHSLGSPGTVNLGVTRGRVRCQGLPMAGQAMLVGQPAPGPGRGARVRGDARCPGQPVLEVAGPARGHPGRPRAPTPSRLHPGRRRQAWSGAAGR